MKLTHKEKQKIVYIDKQVLQLQDRGEEDVSILHELMDYVHDVNIITDKISHEEVWEILRKHSGFASLVLIIEKYLLGRSEDR